MNFPEIPNWTKNLKKNSYSSHSLMVTVKDSIGSKNKNHISGMTFMITDQLILNT